MSNQDALVTMSALHFNDFSKDIAKLNKRTEKVNADLKKTKYQKIGRFPASHSDGMVTVRLEIKDRSKVLWQELTKIMDDHRTLSYDSENKPMPNRVDRAKAASESMPTQHDWVAAGKGECPCSACLREKVKADADRLKHPVPAATKPVSFPIQPASRQWGLWVPCADEVAARAAAGFLAVIAKIGVPQVECRG